MPDTNDQGLERAEILARLSHLDVCILLGVLGLGPDVASGSTVRRRLAEVAGMNLTPGSIQVSMRRMEGHGWMTTRLGAPKAVRGGRAQILYGVTPEGLAVLKDYLAGMDALREGTEYAYPMHRPRRTNQIP